jgi:PncC family amidohydrolase
MNSVEQPETRIGPLLLQSNLKLVTAESCTGGLIGHLLTEQAGSSEYFLGGVISYSNELKMKLLGVHERTLINHGAVSSKTAMEMARGARHVMDADIGVSVTGIAGPGGGTDTKPVGLTYIGVSTPWGDDVREFYWEGDRTANKLDSARAALALVIEKLIAD